MFQDRHVVVVMPAYNAEKTLRKTHEEVLSQGIVDTIIVVDDASHDKTLEIAETLKKTVVHRHDENRGYGANQKTCYHLALDMGADIIIMVHPDYQYTPKLIPAMASIIGNDLYECVLGSRILGGYAVKWGMPLWRYIANRFLTLTENILMGSKLSEFHTGYRAYSRNLLKRLTIDRFSDDFVFDNQILAQIIWYGYPIAEISCPTKYFSDASSINFYRSVQYGIGCLITAATFKLSKIELIKSVIFPEFNEENRTI